MHTHRNRQQATATGNRNRQPQQATATGNRNKQPQQEPGTDSHAHGTRIPNYYLQRIVGVEQHWDGGQKQLPHQLFHRDSDVGLHYYSPLRVAVVAIVRRDAALTLCWARYTLNHFYRCLTRQGTPVCCSNDRALNLTTTRAGQDGEHVGSPDPVTGSGYLLHVGREGTKGGVLTNLQS